MSDGHGCSLGCSFNVVRRRPRRTDRGTLVQPEPIRTAAIRAAANAVGLPAVPAHRWP